MAWSAQTTGFSCSSILEVLRPCSALGAKAGSCSVCVCFLCFFFLYSSCDLDLARVIQNHFLLKGKKKKKVQSFSDYPQKQARRKLYYLHTENGTSAIL